jgi:hypothetical protein
VTGGTTTATGSTTTATGGTTTARGSRATGGTFPSMVGCCVVVCHPFSLSYPFVTALPPDALVASRHPPVPFPLMVGCCVVVRHPFSLSHPCFCKRMLS